MITRSLSGQLTFTLENLSFTLIPFAMALVLVGTTPFWVIIPAFFIMGEKIMDIEVIGILVAAVGVMLLTISWYEVVEEKHEDEIAAGKDPNEFKEIEKFAGVFIALLAAWFLAFYNVMDKKLKNIDHTQLMFFEAIIGIIGFSVYILIEGLAKGNEFRTYSAHKYGLIMSACLLDTLGFEFKTAAFRYDSTRFVSLFGFNMVIYGFVTDIFILIEPVHVLNIIGAVMIHVMTMIITFYKVCKTYRDNKKKKAEEKEKADADADLDDHTE